MATRRIKWPDDTQWVKINVQEWEQYKRALHQVVKYPGCLLFFRNRVYIEYECMLEVWDTLVGKLSTPKIPGWRKMSSFEKKEVLKEYNTRGLDGKRFKVPDNLN